MNVNFEYYKIFYYVAKYKNFTKAAHALHNSQPNVTRAMNCLEQELHCTLFVRTNRGVYLTPEGEKLYVRVSAAMQQFQLAEEELSDSVGLEHGTISIGASEIALNIFLLDYLRAFHREYPGVRLRISNHSTPQAIRAVRSGESDFAVVTTPMQVEPPLKEVPLEEFQDILIGGPMFADLLGQKRKLKDLEDYPLISLGQETTTYRFYHEWFQTHGEEFLPETQVATSDQVLPLVKSDLGLAFLPQKMAEPALRAQEVIGIRLEEEIPARRICLVYDAKRPMNAAAQKLKKILVDKDAMEERKA